MPDKRPYIELSLQRIQETLERILKNSSSIPGYRFYYESPAGMERLESTCMLLIAIGESLKGLDKMTDKQLLSQYPGID